MVDFGQTASFSEATGMQTELGWDDVFRIVRFAWFLCCCSTFNTKIPECSRTLQKWGSEVDTCGQK